MPYIKNNVNQRDPIRKRAIELADILYDEGYLNYAITELLIRFMENRGKSYSVLNTILGVLTCVIQEFYRRMAAPYEDIKIEENGDVDGFSN